MITALIVTQRNVGGSLKAVARLFGIAFLLEQFRRDHDDLRDRAVRFSRSGKNWNSICFCPDLAKLPPGNSRPAECADGAR